MHIGLRIKRIRKIKKLEQSKVCDGIVSTSHFSNIESGRYVPSEEVLRLLAERLDVPASYFLYAEKKSSEVKVLIEEYKHLIDTDVNAANEFLQKYQNNFEYIDSLEQEVSFLVQKCLHLLQVQDLKNAEKEFHLLSVYINEDSLPFLTKDHTFFYYYCAGLLYFYLREYEKSTDFFNKSLKYTDKKSYNHEMKIKYNLALISFYEKDIRNSITLTHSLIHFFEEKNDWYRLIGVYIFQGALFTELKEYENAIIVYKRALELSDVHDSIQQKGRVLHNLGVLFTTTKKLTQALESFEQSLLNKYEWDDKNLFITYLSIIDTKMRLNKLDGIYALILKAKLYCKNQFEEYMLESHEAKLAYLLKDYSTYENKMTVSLEHFYQNKHWADIEDEAVELSQFYYKQRKYKQAYYYLKMNLEAIDHLYKPTN